MPFFLILCFLIAPEAAFGKAPIRPQPSPTLVPFEPTKEYPEAPLKPRLLRRGPKSDRPTEERDLKFGLGMGTGIPELGLFEGFVRFGSYLGLRLYAMPVLPFNIRIEMPADVISTKKGIGVANPDYTIHLKALYGPQVGMDGQIFPFKGAFHIFFGLGYQKFVLTGTTRSGVLICSIFDAAKDPPCGNATSALKTRSELELDARLDSHSFVGRGGLGWQWIFFDTVYMRLVLGMAQPLAVHSDVKVQANIIAPGYESDEILQGALGEVKAAKEAEMQEKARAEVRPYLEKRLPLLGLSLGYSF